jgi:hypothetical protein
VSPRKSADLNHRSFLPAIAAMIFCVWFISVASAGIGTGVRQDEILSGIQVQLAGPQKPATIGDRIRLELNISVPAGYQAGMPQIDKQIGDFSILEFSPEPQVPDSKLPGAAQHRRAIIVAAAYKTGTLTFPPLQIQIRTPEGGEVTTSSPRITIQIQSVLSAKDRNLKDLKQQVEMREPFPWGFWLIVLLALVVLGAVIWYFVKRRRKAAPSPSKFPPRDPLEAAAEELRALLDRGLPEEGMVKYFYVRLSELARTILEAAYGIPAVEQTTFEIMGSLRRSGRGTADCRHRVEAFLRQCDFVKFAKYIPSRPEHETAAKNALQILEDSRVVAANQRPSVVTGSADAPLQGSTENRPPEA